MLGILIRLRGCHHQIVSACMHISFPMLHQHTAVSLPLMILRHIQKIAEWCIIPEQGIAEQANWYVLHGQNLPHPIPDLAVKLLIADMSVQRKPEIPIQGIHKSDILTVTVRNHSCFHMLL